MKLFFGPTLAEIIDAYMARLPQTHYQRYVLARTAAKVGNVRIKRLTVQDLVQLRDFALAEGRKPQTVKHWLHALHRALVLHYMETGIGPDPTPLFRRVPMPRIDNARDRRLEPGEWEAMWKHAPHSLRAVMTVALETGMRRGEIACLRWSMVDLNARMVRLPPTITKTRKGRAIPLSAAAMRVFLALLDPHGRDKIIFGMSQNAIGLAWGRTRSIAVAAEAMPELATLNFHDLRHECLSRLAERGWTTPQLQALSGHSSLRMLSRYTHLRPDTLVELMDHYDDEQHQRAAGAP